MRKVRPHTPNVYRRHVERFVDWYNSHGYSWGDARDLDGLLALWKDRASPSKAEFVNALAGVELA